ncbi:MAG TPA: phosphatase PAP2 family protein, partial [Gemmatimonadaceae bacterium]
DQATFADRAIGVSIALIATYLTATLWPMAIYARDTHDGMPFVVHLAVLLMAAAALRSGAPAVRTFRDLFPLAVGAYLYVELRWLIPGTGRPHFDAMVQRWEHVLFPGNPSATWAPAMPNVALSELLHFAYASYYFLVLVPPIVLYLRGRRDAYACTMLALVVVYALCFACYLVFPVDGPRYLYGPAVAPDGPIRAFVLHLLAAGSSRGTAFPSSHIGAAVVASLCALRFQRPLGALVAALTVGLALGTVYGGFHYAVDGLVGVMVGLISWWGAMAICRALSTPRQQTATAA